MQDLQLKMCHPPLLFFTDIVIVLNAVVLITRTVIISSTGTPVTHNLEVTWDQIAVVVGKCLFLAFGTLLFFAL